jgi:hypothetical protein
METKLVLNVTELRNLQPENALSPMTVTESGIVMVVIVSPVNELLPMIVTGIPFIVPGMTTPPGGPAYLVTVTEKPSEFVT